jgi:predicted permease
MATICTNNIPTSSDTYKNTNTVPFFDSLFTSIEFEVRDIVKYPISTSILNIVSNTPLPKSELLLRHDLTVHKQITQDGYVIKSGFMRSLLVTR